MSHPDSARGEDRFSPDAGRQQRLVFIRGLEMQARLGVHQHEKRGPQRIVVGVELAVEDPWAPTGVGPDELARVVDYEKLVDLADLRVRRVRVTIEKPEAFEDVAAVGVVVERKRP